MRREDRFVVLMCSVLFGAVTVVSIYILTTKTDRTCSPENNASPYAFNCQKY